MAVKFLDLTGLQKFWNKCKAAFVAKDSSGNVTVTGKISADEAYFENGLEADSTVYAQAGINSASTVDVTYGSSVRLWDDDNKVNNSISCSADGKLIDKNGVALATVNDVITAVANAGHLKREKVSALPGVSTAKENVIYMVPNSTNGNNKFDEYMLIDGAFEKTGSSDVDLSGYSTTAQMNTAISTAITNAHTAITETEINNLT